MATSVPRYCGYVCRLCQLTQIGQRSQRLRSFKTVHAYFTERPSSLRQQLNKRKPNAARHTESQITPTAARSSTIPRDSSQMLQRKLDSTRTRSRTLEQDVYLPSSPVPLDTSDPTAALRKLQEDTLRILDSDRLPKDAQVLEIMDQSYQYANLLIFGGGQEMFEGVAGSREGSQTDSSLLSDLDESRGLNNPASKQDQNSSMSLAFRESAAQSLCQTLYTLLEDPKVFINETVLSVYVRIICVLGRPEFIPKIFYLYAHKPIPKPGSYPIQYRQPWSKLPKYSIPRKLADAALDAAILRKDMALCISIIDTTVATDQYKYDKLLRKALLPVTFAGMTVPISWTVSTWASQHQISWDPNTFFWMCMTGAGAYLGTMGTLLWISVSTWNDHHKRVRWVPGTPFGRRFVREEERLYFDRIAQAWGYKDEFKFGEESGEEWEALREILAVRYMDLDRSALLPGMI